MKKVKAKINFSTEILVNINYLNFKLKTDDLDYPDFIGGYYYFFNLSEKEKEKYHLTNPEFLMQHSDHKDIFDLTINKHETN